MSRKIKILAIDREEIILKSIRKALVDSTELQCDITTCNTAIDSLKIIRADTFDLVLIDLVLPGMNGIEVIRRIKNINPSLSVIIMTGFSTNKINPDRESKENSLNEVVKNASGILFKPFTTQEIQNIISNVIDN
jgi:DNA-binding NtrC family response regulator